MNAAADNVSGAGVSELAVTRSRVGGGANTMVLPRDMDSMLSAGGA